MTSPAELWYRAKDEFQNEPDRRRRYRELMIEHGHLVPKQPGDDGNLPCGWPGKPVDLDDTDEPFDCAANGHGPDVVVMADGRAIKAYCRCTAVVWLPQDDQREGR